jgi:hypothetical protein
MLNLNLDRFMLEFTEGTVRNVGPTDKAATAKLFDVETAEFREFGDRRVKLVATDGEGNEVQVALAPEQIEKLTADVERLRENGAVLE